MTNNVQARIAVGIDGSSSAVAALQWATGLAKDTEGSVTAVAAWNYPTALMMPVVGAPLLPAEYVQDAAKANLANALAALPASNVSMRERLVMGPARSVLDDISKDHDVLVIGRSGKGRLKRLWLGSTASHCIHHADCPVVVVRDATVPEERITVGVDGSDESARALAWALSLGADHQVTAVYSHEEWELAGFAGDPRVRPELPASVEEMIAEAVHKAALLADVDASRVTTEIRRGDPRATIVDDAQPDEFLVLGARGHSAISRWLLGSFADYAVHYSPGTVAIFR